MRILFHGPGVVTYRPKLSFPITIGVQPTNVTTINGLRATHAITGNRGNLIHAEAPARIFEKSGPHSCYANIAGLLNAFGDGFSDRLASRFDVIVISMANFIRPTHDGAELFRALKALDGKVKFVVLGAGLQGSHPLSSMTQGNRDLLAIMNEQAAVFGLRGERTAEWLHQNGFHNGTVVGCPSLFSYPESILSLSYDAALAKGSNLDVMTAGHLSFHGQHLDPRGVKLANAFAGIKAAYVMQDEIFGYGALLDTLGLYHDGASTLDAKTINSYLNDRTGLPFDFHRHYYFNEAGAWRQAALRHDIFIGDRFHGGVAALQGGIPAIFLSQDNRVAELTEYFALPALSTAKFTELGLEETMKTFLTPESLAKTKARYRERHAHFAEVMGRHGLKVARTLPN